MGAELGRISGPLLAENLLRHGSDLAFETNLLYLDVNNGRIGINTDTPARELEVNGTTKTTNLIVDTQSTIGDLVFVSNRIQNLTGSIVISPNPLGDPTIAANTIETAKLKLFDHTISTLNDDDNINLLSNGGSVVFNTSKVNVYGDLHATGNITFDGNIAFGNDDTDNVVFKADIDSNLIPNINYFYDLGSSSKKWRTLYADTVNLDTLTSTTSVVNGIDLLLPQGNIYYVSVNGNDSNAGNILHNTFKTVKHALSVAGYGDEVMIFPGTYEEEFPLTVPAGVSVRGVSLRSVKIVPSVPTSTNDAFLLNGETTVSNVTVADFYYDPYADTGYGFRFAPNCNITTRSPYVQNVSVITGAP